MTDELSDYYGDFLDGTYDCVDRIVLNAYNPLCTSPGGFRFWWRQLRNGSDEDLDDTHLMRLAGRFSRRLRAFARARGIPVIDCGRGERKHEIAEKYLATQPVVRGLFLILVGRAVATVWEIERSHRGIRNIAAKKLYVNHYSFHIMDPEWGHITIKISGHPPFGAQIILNGHEYVARQAQKRGIDFAKEGNCFTALSHPADLSRVADTLSERPTVGRLRRVCESWIYTSCLCFALDSEEQERSNSRYRFSIYQVEYSRNLIFRRGGQMDQVFQGLIDRTRARLDVKRLKTIFGAKARPHRDRKRRPHLAVALETPTYDLTVFKLHFGKLTLKGYTKGERVLRFEAVAHNTHDLRCGRLLARLPQIISRLQRILQGFLNNLHYMDSAFVADDILEQLSTPSQVGQTRLGGIDTNRPRMRTALAAVLALAPSPHGFCVSQFGERVRSLSGQTELEYGSRRAAYDLKKIRAKKLVEKIASSRRYRALPQGVRTITTLLVLREKVIQPILAGMGKPKLGRKPKNWSRIDEHYQTLRLSMRNLLNDLGIAA